MSGVSFHGEFLAFTRRITAAGSSGVSSASESAEAHLGQLDRARAEAPPEALDDHDVGEQLDLARQRAVAIGDLDDDLAHLVLVARRRQAPVELEALADVGHVVVGDEAGRVAGELGIVLLVDRLALELGDRLLEHGRVGLEADGGDGARLLGAEQIAGAADLEIVRGDLEAGAELGEALQARRGASWRRR